MPRTKKKVKSIVKTKVISARVTEVVHELLHRQAEDAGMTLSQFAAQMLMKGRVNTSYVFYVHPDEIEAITLEFAAIGNNLNQIAAFFNSGGLPSYVMRENINHAISCMINEMYSKDLSQKIQSCFRSKEARGEIYTPVPFGYKKDQKNHLVLDEEVSDVVVRIFLWKKSGMKEREIAKKLSAQGIQTPFTRRCQLGYLKNTLRVKDPAWQTVFVTKVLENPVYTGTMAYNRIAYDETYRKIGENPRESWRMVPDSHPAIISWELFDEVSALREAEQAVREERKKWCRQRRENNPNIFKGRILCKECGEKLVCHWQSDGSLYFYCKFCHVSISEKDLWNGINKELHHRMEEHRDLQKLVRKSSGKSKLQSKEIATKREIEQASGNIVRLESQKRSGYEQYVLGKLSKEKFLELRQVLENEITTLKQTKAEKEKELAVVQEELRQKKQIAGSTDVLLTADNLLQYVKKIEVDRRKITYTEFLL